MSSDIFNKKQAEVWRNTVECPHRYNICVGAMRSGKSYIDIYRLPLRVRKLGSDENAVIIGNTVGSAERNIIDPLRAKWGGELVGQVKNDGKVMLFGHRCYIFGADRACAAERLQGMSISYCCGDEITTWNEKVFHMIQSRLDRKNSVFDGTCNPDTPNHWFKHFLDSGADIYRTDFTIFDNPALDPGFVKNLCAEYGGTVYYDRYILGKWRSGDGIIYRRFADAPDSFIIDGLGADDEIIMADIGVDFGGNGSAHAFNLTGYTRGYRKIITLDEYYGKGDIAPDRLETEFIEFVRRNKAKYPRLTDIYCDSAEQVLIRGLRNAAARERLGVEIHNAAKGQISQRIRFYTSIMGQGRYFIMKDCTHTIDAFMNAEYDNSGGRRDDGYSNIDSLDAQEYSTERRMNDIIGSG